MAVGVIPALNAARERCRRTLAALARRPGDEVHRRGDGGSTDGTADGRRRSAARAWLRGAARRGARSSRREWRRRAATGCCCCMRIRGSIRPGPAAARHMRSHPDRGRLFPIRAGRGRFARATAGTAGGAGGAACWRCPMATRGCCCRRALLEGSRRHPAAAADGGCGPGAAAGAAAAGGAGGRPL